jgi:capsular polysaccharide transport system ATP-binding protein
MIALERVSKGYRTVRGRRVVLDDASAVFPSGSNVGVLGANGAGKSTLIRLLAGTEMPDRGIIRRDGRVSFPLGYGGTFHGSLSGRENVAFVARIYGARLHETIDYVSDFVELGDYFRYYGAKPYENLRLA